jgi:glyoxylase-like metal-dependent hydrolase (beta-lactamase superfamily II)/rhodanese-related sulfurtransferase
MLQVVIIETHGLGDRSYLAHDGRVGLVVDPQRDIDRVLDAADITGVRITHVAETHVHNDYVSGGLELSRLLGVPYLLAGAEDVSFERASVGDGDEIAVGSLRIKVLSTPGHTPHHLAYLVAEGGRPAALFTGGSLLYGTVGRTDLIGSSATEELTRAQHRSARRLAAEVPDDVAVWPTHGFGSFCSSAKSSGAAASSVGEERSSNRALTLDDEEAFVARLLDGAGAYPTYYAHMGAINRGGPAPIDLRPPSVMNAAELKAGLDAGAWVVDLAERQAYARRHLRGSVSVPFGDQFATYLGWVLPWGAPLILVGDALEQVVQAQLALARIGVDNLRGAATGSRTTLAGTDPIASYPVSNFRGLYETSQADPTLVVLDVRREDERAQGAIAGSVHIPLQDLQRRMGELPSGALWVHCASGFRASVAASLIDRAGREVVLIDDTWSRAASSGLPTKASGLSQKPLQATTQGQGLTVL